MTRVHQVHVPMVLPVKMSGLRPTGASVTSKDTMAPSVMISMLARAHRVWTAVDVCMNPARCTRVTVILTGKWPDTTALDVNISIRVYVSRVTNLVECVETFPKWTSSVTALQATMGTSVPVMTCVWRHLAWMMDSVNLITMEPTLPATVHPSIKDPAVKDYVSNVVVIPLDTFWYHFMCTANPMCFTPKAVLRLRRLNQLKLKHSILTF